MVRIITLALVYTELLRMLHSIASLNILNHQPCDVVDELIRDNESLTRLFLVCHAASFLIYFFPNHQYSPVPAFAYSTSISLLVMHCTSSAFMQMKSYNHRNENLSNYIAVLLCMKGMMFGKTLIIKLLFSTTISHD